MKVDLEIGKEYRSTDGRKGKVLELRDSGIFIVEIEGGSPPRGTLGYSRDGTFNGSKETYGECDLVSIWQDELPSPIHSKTVTYIEEGTYGRVHVHGTYSRCANISFSTESGLSGAYAFTKEELRAAAITFTHLADFLEEQGK